MNSNKKLNVFSLTDRVQGGNLQNFLGKFIRFFVTLKCFKLFIENRYFMIYTVVNITL